MDLKRGWQEIEGTGILLPGAGFLLCSNYGFMRGCKSTPLVLKHSDGGLVPMLRVGMHTRRFASFDYHMITNSLDLHPLCVNAIC